MPTFYKQFQIAKSALSLFFVYREHHNSKLTEDGEKHKLNRNDERGFNLENPAYQEWRQPPDGWLRQTEICYLPDLGPEFGTKNFTFQENMMSNSTPVWVCILPESKNNSLDQWVGPCQGMGT